MSTAVAVLGESVCLGGVCLEGVHLPPVDGMTDACAFPQLLLRTVKIQFVNKMYLIGIACRREPI